MKNRASRWLRPALLAGFLSFLPLVLSAQHSSQYQPPEGVAFRTASIISDGTRIHAEIFSPSDRAGQRLPTIIQGHGWGGTASALRNDAVDFARAGYHVINFDYRGWGESDARVALTGVAPSVEGLTYTAEVRKVEGIVDPFDQTDDWFSVIHWAVGEPIVDSERMGIRGTSLSGGHVIFVAAHEPRVGAVVSQVPATDPGTAMPPVMVGAHEESTRRARGEIGYPQPRVRDFGLTGTAISEKFLRYSPSAVAHRVVAPTLVVVAENEELYNNEPQGKLAYDRLSGPKQYVVIPEITHYGVYTTARAEVVGLALDWFDRFLR
jgi:uncharacterized protein